MLTRIVKMSFKEECSQLFLEKFDAIKEQVNNQSGCQSMRMVRDIKNTNIFITLSVWDSEQDLNNYRNSDFFKSTWSTIKPWFNAKAEAWSADPIWPIK